MQTVLHFLRLSNLFKFSSLFCETYGVGGANVHEIAVIVQAVTPQKI